MEKVMIQRRVIIAFIFLLFCGETFAQTKTKVETTSLGTGHASISMTAKRDGSYLEVRATNTHPTKTFKISFVVTVTLRSDKVEYDRTLELSTTLAPGKSNYVMDSGSSHFANANTSDTYSSLIDAHLNNFDWEEVSDGNNNETSSSNSPAYNGSSNVPTTTYNDSRPPANASPQELAEWQRKQYANTEQVKTNSDRLNNLNTIQQKSTPTYNYSNNNVSGTYSEAYKQQQQQNDATAGAVINEIDSWLEYREEQREREKMREERQAEAQREREYEEAKIKRAKEQKISNRKTALAEFPAKDVPLGSKEKATSIYYFVYAYNNTINDEYGTMIYISNVFEVGKYADGTMPYTASIKNEITNLTPFEEVLHGYYYTQEEAEQLRQTLISILKSNGVTVNEVNYKGKPADLKITTDNMDTQSKNSSKYGKTISVEENVTPAEINTKPQTPIRETQKQDNSKYGKTIKLE